MRRDLVFLHVPKTGGTAVRNALVKACKGRRILFDYGPDSEETSKLIRTEVYGVAGEGVPDDFRRRVDGPRGMLLVGHLQANKYWGHFHPDSFVTFLRDPVDRLISEYNHLARHRGLEQSLEDFVRHSRHRRHLVYLMRGVDPMQFGFVGFTDTLPADVERLSAWLGLTLEVGRENEGSYDPVLAQRAADPVFREWVRKFVADDVKIYNGLKQRFQAAKKARTARLAAADDYRGRVKLVSGGRLVGFAVHRGVEAIVELEIVVGEKVVARVPADRYRPYLKTVGLSRTGIGAFVVPLRRLLWLQGLRLKKEAVTVRIAGTTRELAGSPLRRPPPAR